MQSKSPFETYPEWLARTEKHFRRQRQLKTAMLVLSVAALLAMWTFALVTK